MKLAFLAGLFVGEGCFTLSIFRRDGRKKTNLRIKPLFSVSMRDEESMEHTARIMTELGLPHYVYRTKIRFEIKVEGLQRMARFLPEIIPLLTGTKKKSAEVVQEFVVRRLQHQTNAVYDEADIDLVDRVRKLNFGNGKYKAVRMSILRDYTSRPLGQKGMI